MGLDSPAAQYFDRLGEWVDHFVEQLSDDPEEDDEEGLLKVAFDHAMDEEADADEEDRIPPDSMKSILHLAIDHARHAKAQELRDAMVYAREQFDEIEILSRMATPGSEINIHRQGFLLLMTAFDAAVFDLTQIAFKSKFFDLVGVFGKQDKMSMESLGEAGSFEAFRDQIIEEQLKKRYAKDLLGLLKSLDLKLVPDGEKDVVLTELLLRRNIHVHNRGEVDERYLEADPKTGKPKYNYYGLKLKQIAVIDESYLEMANRLCKFCVDRICKWAFS